MGVLWIDVLTPKQALFAKSLVERAPSKVKCAVTTRDYFELNRFLSHLDLVHQRFGRHGGGSLEEKLRASVERERLLVSFAKSGFDYSLSFLSPEAARVSFGLGIRHYACSDSPHSNAPSRLVVPLSRFVLTPYPINKNRWTRYGIKPSGVHKYHALDPWAWLKYSKLKSSKKVYGRIIVRLEEWFASYFKKGMGISDTLPKLIAAIKQAGDFEITLVPRYDEQRRWVARRYGRECIVPETAIDGADLISQTDLLIGGGATMTQEAALLGVPNISYFPSTQLDVFTEYYFPKKMSVEASNPKELLRSTSLLLKHIDKSKELFLERADKETKTFEDPVKFVFGKISND